MSYTLQQHAAYHAWATERMAETLRTGDHSIINKEQKSSFASIAKTLLHLWDAEIVWLKRFEGTNLTEWPSKNFSGGTEELIQGYVASAKAINTFVKGASEAKLHEKFSYKTMKGDPFEDVIEDMVYHVINHGSYHRGQIVTMLRELGVNQILSMDIIIYQRSLKTR
jgi:uncharacterized damage-inducible protein DinB